MNRLTLAALMVAMPLQTMAEVQPGRILGSVVDVAQSSDPKAAVTSLAQNYFLGTANSELSKFTNGLLGERVKYLSLSLGVAEDELEVEGMSVIGLHEDKNWFIFNQSSVVNYDGRTTLNLGLGARHINDAETVIFGLNAFHDYEFGSEHRRASVGAEVLTSILQLRANYYKGLTDTRLYEGINEEALDGHDIKLTYELPWFYDSDIYFLSSHWYDGEGYRTSTDEIGVSAEVARNLMVSVAGSRTDGGPTDLSASVSYRIVFGQKPDNRVMRDGKFKFALEPIRDMLYQPVQRENRIKKKRISLGVTVGAY